MSAAVITSACSIHSAKLEANVISTPLSSAFNWATLNALRSMSQAMARLAPALAAAIATTPEPDPTSTTVLPRTRSGFSSNHQASPCPDAQQNEIGRASCRERVERRAGAETYREQQ